MSGGDKVYLVDGSSYIYRAFFAIRDLKTSRGLPSNAAYGFTTMLTKLLQDFRPPYLSVVLDAKGPTFRHLVYEHYKANRPEMPDSLRAQLPWIRQILEAMRIRILEKEGYEADDVIGTLARAVEAEGHDVIIITGDKDLLQLVSPRVITLDTMYNRSYDEQAVLRRYGVPPSLLPDVFGLMGDDSDNIPGVPGIGEKRARELIRGFGGLEALLARVEEVPSGKLRDALKKYADQARLSKQLATVDCKVPLDVDLEDLRPGVPDRERLRVIFKELEFHTLLQEWTQAEGVSGRDYRTVTERTGLQEVVKGLWETREFAIYVAADRSEVMRAELVGLAFCARGEAAHYIPLGHRTDKEGSLLPVAEVLERLRPLLEDSSVGKVGHDLKSAVTLLARNGVCLRGIGTDVMVASYVLNPSRRSHAVGDLALEYLDEKVVPPHAPSRGQGGTPSLAEVPVEKATVFACQVADVALRLCDVLLPKMKADGTERLFRDLEMPLIPVLARMEMHGIRVNVERLRGLGREMGDELLRLEGEIHGLAGEPFNISSPQQLAQVLFERLKLPVVKKTKTGYSTDTEVLQELAKAHELPAKVLEYRTISKLKSTYVDALPQMLNPHTGRIHTSFNQAVTATGRLSSSEPNVQNIPVRGKMGRRIREAFVPEEGWWFLSADYSQVELRILAHLSQDPILMEAFHRGEDIHARTAAEIFGVSPETITEQMRREAKVIVFGIVYGMSAFGLARELGVEPKVAEAYIEGYFQRYRGVRDYLDRIVEGAREKGYVETLMGRRRYVPEISSSNRAVRRFAERAAINTPIQGTAADLIKKAMISIQGQLEARALATRMLLQVHDELLLEVPEGERDAVESLVREEMEGVKRLRVPLKVEIGWGKDWAEAH
ncbi:MAG: DNA polymerase I, partial [Thermodesulfobacteriota bacterium]